MDEPANMGLRSREPYPRLFTGARVATCCRPVCTSVPFVHDPNSRRFLADPSRERMREIGDGLEVLIPALRRPRTDR